jgi:hypothetical protein
MRTATGTKAPAIKTWGIHALHHGWSYEEVLAMAAKLQKKTVAEILAWAKAQRECGWAKGC